MGPPPNKSKQIPQRHDLRNFRLLICLERTFLRASAAASSTSKSSVISVISRLLEFEDKTSSDKSFLLYLLLSIKKSEEGGYKGQADDEINEIQIFWNLRRRRNRRSRRRPVLSQSPLLRNHESTNSTNS